MAFLTFSAPFPPIKQDSHISLLLLLMLIHSAHSVLYCLKLRGSASMCFCGGAVSRHKETSSSISELLDTGCHCTSTAGLLSQSPPLLHALHVHHWAGPAWQEKHWCAAHTADMQTGFAGEAGGSNRTCFSRIRLSPS